MTRELKDTLTFRSGVSVANRMVMSPMLTYSGLKGGFASPETLDYYRARSQAAGMSITEFHYVSEEGGPCSPAGWPEQLGAQDDEHLESLKAIASALKKDGNKAILQIHHGGREARVRFDRGQDVYAPSAIDFDFLPFVPKELSDEQICRIIADFGKATKRAIDAGFDGVEIHGANHYLLQQFFSKLSNVRDDAWGGSLEKRMAFPLAVVDEVRRVVDAYAPYNFLIGYRISPEEIHGPSIGYTWHESTRLVAEIVKRKLDYIHLSLWAGYASKPADSEKSYAELFREVLDSETKLIAVDGVFSEEAAQDAVTHYSDLIALGRSTLIDPEFGKKVMENKGESICSKMSTEQLKTKLHLTPGLIEAFSREDQKGLPMMPGSDSIYSLHQGLFD